MIRIPKSQTADTRTCDFANVTKETLLASSQQHISDVEQALRFFMGMLVCAAEDHVVGETITSSVAYPLLRKPR